jgi:hypothetical protein
METDVTRNIEEQVSAFIDGELPDEELQLLVRRLERDEEHRATLARYALVGNLLRNDGAPSASKQFRAGVMAAIADEKVVEEAAPPVASSNGGWRKPLAMAAVVALVVIGFRGMGVFEEFGEAGTDLTLSASSQRELAENISLSGSAGQQAIIKRPAAVDRERLTSYLVAHGDYARSFQGPMGNSRIFVQQASFEQ